MTQANKTTFNPWEAWTDMQKTMATSGADMNAWGELAKRNMELMTAAGKMATESFQAMAKSNAEIMQKTTQEGYECMKEAFSSKTPQEAQSKCADYMQTLVKDYCGHASDSTQKASKTCKDLVDVCNKGATETVSTLSKQAKKNS